MPARKGPPSKAAASKGMPVQAQAFDPLTLSPNDLCERARRSLSAHSEKDRTAMCRKLLAGLSKAGVNIASSIVLLGLPARSADEFMPSDMGKLLRFVHMNWPNAIAAIAELLARLLAADSLAPEAPSQKASKAA